MRYERGDVDLEVRVVDAQGVTAPVPMFGRSGWLFGWSVCESSGAGAAVVQVIDGQDGGGQLLAQIPLAANAVSTVHPGNPGWPLESGLFLNVISGQVTAVFVVGEQITR